MGVAALVVAAFALGSLWRGGGSLFGNNRRDEEGGGLSTDSKDYRIALARTRQAVFTNKAVVLMNNGNPARALVELKRALAENAVAREPLLNARVEKQDMVGLYRLHLLNGEVPPDFPTLLQLREMFELSDAEAERMERELMGSNSLFSI